MRASVFRDQHPAARPAACLHAICPVHSRAVQQLGDMRQLRPHVRNLQRRGKTGVHELPGRLLPGRCMCCVVLGRLLRWCWQHLCAVQRQLLGVHQCIGVHLLRQRLPPGRPVRVRLLCRLRPVRARWQDLCAAVHGRPVQQLGCVRQLRPELRNMQRSRAIQLHLVRDRRAPAGRRLRRQLLRPLLSG